MNECDKEEEKKCIQKASEENSSPKSPLKWNNVSDLVMNVIIFSMGTFLGIGIGIITTLFIVKKFF